VLADCFCQAVNLKMRR